MMGTLDDRIATLKTELDQLAVDQPSAFARFKHILLEANQTLAVLLVAGITSGPVGSNIDLPVILIPGTFAPSAIQADFVLPAGLTFVSAALGPIPIGVGKSLQTNMVGDVLRVIVFGLNQTPITDG